MHPLFYIFLFLSIWFVGNTIISVCYDKKIHIQNLLLDAFVVTACVYCAIELS